MQEGGRCVQHSSSKGTGVGTTAGLGERCALALLGKSGMQRKRVKGEWELDFEEVEGQGQACRLYSVRQRKDLVRSGVWGWETTMKATAEAKQEEINDRTRQNWWGEAGGGE